MKEIKKICIPTGYKFLSECISELPSNCIFNKGITGSGGTTLELKSNRNSIICVPNISLVLNKQSKDVFGVYGKISNGDIKDYLKLKTQYKKFIVVYDSLPRLIEVIGKSIYDDYFLLIDEYHILFNSYVFRNKAVRNILSSFHLFKKFCFMTATPLEEETILDELKDIDVVEVKWEDAYPVSITIEDTYYVSAKLKDYIKFCFQNDYNLHIFINSMKSISKIIRGSNLLDYRIICSEDSASKYKLLNCESITSPIKKINFYTATCFEGVDIYDPIGKTIVVSDSHVSTTMIDISTLFIQICGRLRDSIYKDQVTFIVNANNHRYCKYGSFSEFKQMSDESEKFGKTTEKLFIAGDDDYKKMEQIKYCYETYSNIYVVKDDDNNIIYDPNLKTVDLKNYDIVHNIYASSFSILKNVSNQNKLEVKNVISERKNTKDIIKIIKQSFDYNRLYSYDELINIISSVLNEYNLKFKRNDFNKYVNAKQKRIYKDGKKIRLYELIK